VRAILVDAQLPPALARAIGERGHLAEHVADVGLVSADDSVISRTRSITTPS
jgi:predicted nuclease of predicted toxin-antitoxin system